MKAEASEKEMKRQSGNGQGRALEQMGLAPPPGLYPDLKSVRPPPYAPQQDLQQVQVMVKEGAVEVEIEEMDTMNERIKLLSARMDAAEQQGRSLLRGELEQEGSMHEGDEKSRQGSVIESDDEGQVKGTHRVCIEGVMTMNSPVASRTRQKQTVQRSQSEASGRYSAQPEAIGEVIEDSWEGIWVLEVDEAEVGASREVLVLCVVAVNTGGMNAPHSKGAANLQGHLQGDGVLLGAVLVVVAGDHTPHDTRGNDTRLQPTYRRPCTQHGARRETRGIVEGAHRGPP